MSLDLLRKAVQWKDSIDAPCRDCFARHAVDDTRRFVLSQRPRAGLAQLGHTRCAVVAHAGQDRAKRISAGGLGGRAEQHIDGRAVASDIGTVDDPDTILHPLTPKDHVAVSRGNQGKPSARNIAVDRFPNFDFTKGIKTLGKGTGEMFRHVLDDDDCGRRCGKGCKDGLQRIGSAG